MFDGEKLNHKQVTLPERLETSYVEDLVFGDTSILDADDIWVDPNGKIWFYKKADLYTPATFPGHYSGVRIIRFYEGFVLDLFTSDFYRKPEGFTITEPEIENPEWSFDDFEPIIHLVVSEEDYIQIAEYYRQQFHKELDVIAEPIVITQLKKPKSKKGKNKKSKKDKKQVKVTSSEQISETAAEEPTI